MFYLCICCTGGPSYVFSIVNKIWWKFDSVLIQVIVKWSLWHFAHGMAAVLSWHVQTFVVTWYTMMELQLNQFSINFELQWKNNSWNGPLYRKFVTIQHAVKLLHFHVREGIYSQMKFLSVLLYIFLTVTRVTIIFTPHFKVSVYMDVFPPPGWILHANLLQCDPRGKFKGPQVVTIY